MAKANNAPHLFLFKGLSDEAQAALIRKQKSKVSFTQADYDKERAEKDALKRGVLKSKESFDRIWREMAGEPVNDLGDGWCRIFTLNRFGLLQVNCTVRLEEEWLGPLSKNVRDFKDMTQWPEGSLPKSNPWKQPHYHMCVLALPIWHEDIKQFSISFGGPVYKEPVMSPLARTRQEKKRREGKLKRPSGTEFSTLTYYFGPELVKDEHHEDMWTLRKQKASVPWKRGDPVVRKPKIRVPSFFQPDEYDMRMLRQATNGEVTVIQAKTNLICRYRREKPHVLAMDVKIMVEFWLRACDLPDYSGK